jgi:hypothetical protein
MSFAASKAGEAPGGLSAYVLSKLTRRHLTDLVARDAQ